MADLEVIKQSRTTGKRNVTSTARNLVNSVELGSDAATLKPLLAALEDAFEKFCDAHEDYVEACPEDDSLDKYMDDVKNKYMCARKAHNELSNFRVAEKCHKDFECCADRLVKLLDKLDNALEASSSGSEEDIDLLNGITERLDPLLSDLLDNKDKLIGVGESRREESQYHDLVIRVDNAKLMSDMAGRRGQARLLGASLSPLINGLGSGPNSPVSISNQNNAVSQIRGPITPSSVAMRSQTVSFATPTGSSDVVGMGYTGTNTVTVNGTIPVSAVINPGVSLGARPTVSSYPPGSSVSSNASSHATPTLNPYTSPTSHIAGSSGMPSYFAGYGSNNTPHSSGVVGNVYTAAAPPWVPLGRDTYNSPHLSHASQGTNLRTKRPTLPTFSGERSDWSEFKYVWRSLAEGQFDDRILLAYELKKACSKGKAAESIKHISVTSDSVYDELWSRLSEEYDDQGLSVQAALNRLMTLKLVEERDYKGLVKLVDVIEGVHNQLRELGQLEAISMVDVDRLSNLLPHVNHIDWMRRYRDLPESTKIRPFAEFVRYLKSERAYLARLAESSVQHASKKPESKKPAVKHSANTHGAESTPGSGTADSKGKSCVIHGNRNQHTTSECYSFKKMPPQKREETIRKSRRCYQCFGEHFKSNCSVKMQPCKCGGQHHPLLCHKDRNQEKRESSQSHAVDSSAESNIEVTVSAETHLVSTGTMALYPIHRAYVVGRHRPITVFMDGGSNASYITERCAASLKLKRVDKVTLDVTTVGGDQKEYRSSVYEVPLRVSYTQVSKILVYSLEEITGPLSPLDENVLRKLFPGSDPSTLMRPSRTVDVLIGTDYFGLHPKSEIAKAGEHLSIMKGELGACLVGTHPQLKEGTVLSSSVPRRLNSSSCRASTHLQTMTAVHPMFSRPDSFFVGEDFGTESVPKCGGCKCGHCPIPGHDLSFKEEQELHMIRSSLEYRKEERHWVTSYPWLIDPMTLPNNYKAAAATLKSTERSLSKDPAWAESYSQQMQDMLDRKAARKLTRNELDEWQGPVYYISHLAVVSPKSKSTPVRIVFNSSQVCKGISLNSCLAKGPDSYRNSVLAILLRWREESVAIVGDIRKMFHSVFLKAQEQHCHRFLWRNLESDKDPEVYVMQRVNMGDRPAPAIATEALFMTAAFHKEEMPRAAEFIENSSYVDDLIDSVESTEIAVNVIAKDSEKILESGGFAVKNWQISGQREPLNGKSELKGDENHVGVLGVLWNPEEDSINHAVALNFSPKKHGAATGPDLERDQVPACLPGILTRRQVLRQVMAIYDPMGLASPFTLLAKVYLRDTWLLKLDWDDPLPSHLHSKWKDYFTAMYELEDLTYPRCLRPEGAEGNPWLIIMSDGSDTAYGCAAYARWKCSDGSIKMRLIMAKSRIAPVDRVSTPRMELNGAVLSKRCRIVIQTEMRYKFERVLHLVDSETVLNMLHKTSCRFKIYEGVRIGEIQAAMQGDMSEWAWIPGEDNTADWLTRGRMPAELDAKSDWFCGPAMLLKPFDAWNIKFGKTSDEAVPGEKKLSTHTAKAVETDSILNINNVSSLSKALRVMARVIGVIQNKSFRGGHISLITPKSLKLAEQTLVREAQSHEDMQKADYRRLNPAQKADGIWVVGASRLAHHNPMSVIHNTLPVFIPRKHPFARLAMEDAHKRGHRGRDATLASFRNKFWTPAAPALAKSVRQNCQLCKLRDGRLAEQEMGSLPIDRLRPSTPFNSTMVDLFGPYSVRGEVQKRVSGKAWAVIYTDMVSRAVHIEVAFGYDTSSFLLTLSRFTSVRGWPHRIYSDPGSQLLGASREINEAAARLGAQHGLEWVVGPADSPWHQGAVEALVKSAKRAINLAVHNQRLSAPELLTVCTEAANLINERPIGLLPSLDSEINVLTPNCLLLGRATASNPSGWQPGAMSLRTRYHLVSAIGEQFWKHWVELFAPSLVYRPKWHVGQRDLQVGDTVLVADSNVLRGEYRLAIVTQVHPSLNGCVRSATVAYKSFKVGESVRQYKGAPYTSVKRSVQRLVLLVPVDQAKGKPDLQASPVDSNEISRKSVTGESVRPMTDPETAAAAHAGVQVR